jgi:hypothetical protein
MTSEQRAQINTALARYGAGLVNDFIAKGDKVLSVSFEVKKNRLRAMRGPARLLASYPATRIGAGVSDFVEKFWFWEPIR